MLTGYTRVRQRERRRGDGQRVAAKPGSIGYLRSRRQPCACCCAAASGRTSASRLQDAAGVRIEIDDALGTRRGPGSGRRRSPALSWPGPGGHRFSGHSAAGQCRRDPNTGASAKGSTERRRWTVCLAASRSGSSSQLRPSTMHAAAVIHRGVGKRVGRRRGSPAGEGASDYVDRPVDQDRSW